MQATQIKLGLMRNRLFSGMKESEIDEFLKRSEIMIVPKDHVLFEEGSSANEFFILLSGKCEVIKKDPNGEVHPISYISAGEAIGEMALIEKAKRSATIRTTEESQLLKIAISDLPSDSKIIYNFSVALSERLRSSNEFAAKSIQNELQNAKISKETSRFLFYILIILSTCLITYTELSYLVKVVTSTTVVSSALLILLMSACIHGVRHSSLPLSYMGITFKNWFKISMESIVLTIPILLFATFAKWMIITFFPEEQYTTVFSHVNRIDIYFGLTYIALVPCQEFMARCVIQSFVELSLQGPHRTARSIFLAAWIFGSLHIFISPSYAIAAFFAGLFWGWLFARQRSIVGISVSHALLGGYCLIVLNLHKLFVNT